MSFKSSGDEKRRLIGNSNNVNVSKIEETQQKLIETEQIAISVLGELSGQRKQLEASEEKLRDVSGMTRDSSDILRDMAARNCKGKLMLYMIIVCLFAGICLECYSILMAPPPSKKN